MKRHFLQQAAVFDYAKHPIAGQLMSEKLDGTRAFWDGGISRGINVLDVPWANTAKDKKTIFATGLWSRYGNVIYAPTWWLNTLPLVPLDGELFTGRGNFQQTRKFVSKHTPVDSEWEQVSFMIFDSPCLSSILYDSHIKQGGYDKHLIGCEEWVDSEAKWNHTNPNLAFRNSYAFLKGLLADSKYCKVIPQIPVEDVSEYEKMVKTIAYLGGEGVILRDPQARYIPERPAHITKTKPYFDAEATVVGYITGRATDRGSKLLGLMGALIVKYKDVTFKLSGFTDSERALTNTERKAMSNYADATEWAERNPETECPDWIEATHFHRGSHITFRYRELSDTGVPKEARYDRTYQEV